MPRLYLCFKIVSNSETNDWVPPILILLLLQPNWKHGKSFTNILPYKSRRVRPTSSADHRSSSDTYPEQSQLPMEQSGSKRSKLSRPCPLFFSFTLLG